MNRRIEVLRLWLGRRPLRTLRHRRVTRREREYRWLGDGCSIGVLDRFYAELRRD